MRFLRLTSGQPLVHSRSPFSFFYLSSFRPTCRPLLAGSYSRPNQIFRFRRSCRRWTRNLDQLVPSATQWNVPRTVKYWLNARRFQDLNFMFKRPLDCGRFRLFHVPRFIVASLQYATNYEHDKEYFEIRNLIFFYFFNRCIHRIYVCIKISKYFIIGTVFWYHYF